MLWRLRSQRVIIIIIRPIPHVSHLLIIIIFIFVSDTMVQATYKNTQTHIDTQKQQNNQ